MATTSYGVNHPLAVKQWARKLHHEALAETYFARFMGEGSENLIQIKREVSKDAGDRITCGLRMLLSGDGIEGDATLEGNEEALTTYSDNIFINQLRHAVRSAGKMSEQRVPFSVREESLMGLKDWWTDRMDTVFFNHICGNSAQTDTKYTGHNATTAPTSAAGNTRILYADGGSTTEGSLSASQHFQLTYIDRAVLNAKEATPILRPIAHNGGKYYCMFLHPQQVFSLRTDAGNSGARITWFDAQKDAGPRDKEQNNIFSGALGIYNNVILHESTRVVSPSANVYRSVLCGAQAATIAFGRPQGAGDGTQNWYEELFDYGNQLGVAGGQIWGLKKNVFNSIDFATIVVSTFENN